MCLGPAVEAGGWLWLEAPPELRPFSPQVDEGGKTLLVDSWSTFLKARLVCGHPADPQRFHRLRDAFVLSEGQQGGGMLYGIFSSAW